MSQDMRSEKRKKGKLGSREIDLNKARLRSRKMDYDKSKLWSGGWTKTRTSSGFQLREIELHKAELRFHVRQNQVHVPDVELGQGQSQVLEYRLKQGQAHV